MKHAPLLLLVAGLSIAGTFLLMSNAAPVQGGSSPTPTAADEYAFIAYTRESKDPIKLMDGPGTLCAVIGQTGKYQLCEGPVDNLKPIVTALRHSKDGGGDRLEINVRVQNGIFLRPITVNLNQGMSFFGVAASMSMELYSPSSLQQFEPSDSIGFTVIFRHGV